MPDRIRVIVAGYGKLGSELARGLAHSPDVELVGVVRRQVAGGSLDIAGHTVPVGDDIEAVLERTRPDALVEASLPGVASGHIRAALQRQVASVIATSGLDDVFFQEVRQACEQQGVGVVVAPNLSLGAVILIHLSAIAGRFFDHADVIEMHRDRKLDAPSGTALHTARVMAQAREKDFARAETEKFTLPEVRGGELHGIGIHSIRLPGLIAHQQVIFGGLGQTLTLRHDTTSNESYVPGAILAIKHAVKTKTLTVGLAALLGLE
jgi:4-hydroxy-tetrahydrodipicolinate reductase